jgi:quercetin dioxygenase-like cupin family protein
MTMRIHTRLSFVLFASMGCIAHSDQVRKDSGHVEIMPDQIQWAPATAPLPAGAQVAVLDGDSSKAGAQYSIAVKMPSGYQIPPHWHPMDASVVVVKGTFVMGLGDKFDKTKGHDLPAGSFMRMSKGVRHFEWTKGETVIYVYGVGPLDTIYVNPSDDPRNKSTAKK